MDRQSVLAHYGLDISMSPVQSDYEDSDDEEEFEEDSTEMKPQELLQLALEKRWELRRKENLRCQLLHTRLILNLSIHIEESKKIFSFNQESTVHLVKPSPPVPEEFEQPAPKRFKTGN